MFETKQYLPVVPLQEHIHFFSLAVHPSNFQQLPGFSQTLQSSFWVSRFLLLLNLNFVSCCLYLLLQKCPLLLSEANLLLISMLHALILLSVLDFLPHAAVQGLLCTWIFSAALRGRISSSFLFLSRKGGTKSTAARSGSLPLCFPATILLQNTQFAFMSYRTASVVTHRLKDHRGWIRFWSS